MYQTKEEVREEVLKFYSEKVLTEIANEDYLKKLKDNETITELALIIVKERQIGIDKIEEVKEEIKSNLKKYEDQLIKLIITRYARECLIFNKYLPRRLDDLVFFIVKCFGDFIVAEGLVTITQESLKNQLVYDDLKIIKNKRTGRKYLISEAHTNVFDKLKVLA